MSSLLKRKLCETKLEKPISEREMIKIVNESFPEETLIGLNSLQRITLFKLVTWLLANSTVEKGQDGASNLNDLTNRN